MKTKELSLDKKSNASTAITKDVTCPFCGILCDDLVIQNQNNKLKVIENGCSKAIEMFQKELPESSAQIKGKNVSLDDAIDSVCKILKKSHTPLIAGLGTDVSGIRNVMELADKTGAILDHMHGNGLIRNTLVLQDLGWIMTTMAEIKNRADLVIFAGTDATNFSRFYERVIWNKESMFKLKNDDRQIVYIGANLNSKPGINPNGKRPTVLDCETEEIGEIISSLHALVAGATLDVNEVAGIKVKTLQTLAEQMKTAKYGVIVWAPGELDFPHAELTIQNFCETVKYLTRFTRFAGFSLGGNDGGMTANSVCAWQSGYPLRVNFNKGYPDYDAYRYSTHNVLKNKEVDSLLWISSFSSNINTPHASIPTIVMGMPDTKLKFKPDVFIPVSTPGIDHTGQIIRTDSVVSLPLKKVRTSPYASVPSVLNQVIERM
ncbi:MAG TPA: formylmethanofuran dehydrogenase subunit B [Thiotrichaceae bacterium]|nr:formylmethanofuran dehydrogenase subunit B [Thiotrichaceae bacterium]